MSSPSVLGHRPAPLDATANPPALFDGTTRLYTSYTCPYAQRVWITRNFKVDIAYIPFIERYEIILNEIIKCDITAERPKLSAWIEQMNKIDAYAQTKTESKKIVEIFKRKHMQGRSI